MRKSLFVFSLWALSCKAENYSLTRAMQLAEQRAIDVAIADQEVEVAMGEQELAQSYFWPQLSGFAEYNLQHQNSTPSIGTTLSDMQGDNYGFNRDSSFGLLIQHNIFNSFSTTHQYRAAKLKAESANQMKIKALQLARIATLEAYFESLAFNEKTEYTKELISFVNKALEQAKKVYAGQAMTKVQLLAVKTTIGNMRLLSESAEVKMQSSLRALHILTGTPGISAKDLSDSLRTNRGVATPLTNIIDSIKNHDSGYKARLLSVDSTDEARRAVLAGHYPSLDLISRISDKETFVGLRLKVPLFSGFSYSADSKRYSAEKAERRLELKKYEQNLVEFLRSNMETAKSSRSNIEALSAVIKDSQSIWLSANKGLRLNEVGTYVWKDALQSLVNAEFTMIDNLLVNRKALGILALFADPSNAKEL